MSELFDTTLFDYLKENQEMSLAERLEIIEKVARGVKHMENNNGVRLHHLDLKPSNVYLKKTDGKWNGRLCVADFGITIFENFGLSDCRKGSVHGSEAHLAGLIAHLMLRNKIGCFSEPFISHVQQQRTACDAR